MSGDDRSTLGDCCQKHDPRTAPVVCPYRATLDEATDNLRADYHCACGNNWSCWWSAIGAGWTAADVEWLNAASGQENAA